MNKFIKDYPVYYINLSNRQDRDYYFSNHLKENQIENYTRIEACTPDSITENILDQGRAWGMPDNATATTISHLTAIKNFIEKSDKEYAVICEDDADLSNLQKLSFSIKDLFDSFKLGVECIQLGVCTREDVNQIFKIRIRSFWDFNCSTYIVNKDYAKKLLNKYSEKENFSLNNFKSEEVLEYRNNTIFHTAPTAESVVYEETNTVVCPVATFILTESSLNLTDENNRQTSKSRQDFLAKWQRYDTINLTDLF
jgi:GR25 family glycosyltransferase involved in LPS biosynthesis